MSNMQTTLTYRPAVELVDRFIKDRVVTRIWERDISVWGATPGSADARSIATRLGWLDVARTMQPELERVARVAYAARQERIEAVYLLGMGGSSLCAQVLRRVFRTGEKHPELFVMDTTDEYTIVREAGRMQPARTWFLVASKSGGTVEVASLERYFRGQVSAALGPQPGKQFIAITDPGTTLHELATSSGYREVFLNPADIGGRFSALSLFGLVPHALIGGSPNDLLAAGSAMAEGCRQENHANAGLELGAFIGAATLEGRDKLTLALPPSLASLGLWIEQLVAESTGKHGKGALPVVDEPLGGPEVYGSDRAFVAISTERDEPDPRKLHALEAAGFPVLRLSTRIDGLGAEFFRWEFATAVAGAALGINPFDEPNVAEAKEKTKTLLAAFASHGTLPESPVIAASEAVAVSTTFFKGSSPHGVLREALASVRPGDYIAFLSYLPGNADIEPALAEVRSGLREKFRIASTFGVGPRYLHSTGQYHKGGPNAVVAFVLTADDKTRTEIPGAGYSFSVLKRAQALGDAETLATHDRRAVVIHCKGDAESAPSQLEQLFEEALR
jgi:glucose-6-phosphate isomerase